MKLSLLHEAKPGRDKLREALKFIYGHSGRPTGINRPDLHQLDDSGRDGSDVANRATGGQTGRMGDGGTPWKPRHRQFFRMSNDGATKNRY